MSAAAQNLPALTGSEEQIRWAEEIRKRLLKSMNAAIRTTPFEFRVRQLLETKNWMEEQTSASWWIQNRDRKPSTANRTRAADALQGYALMFGKKRASTGPRS